VAFRGIIPVPIGFLYKTRAGRFIIYPISSYNRRDALGLNGALCWTCIKGSGGQRHGAGPGSGPGGGAGNGQGIGPGGNFGPGSGGCSIFARGAQDYPAPTGCYAGESGPPEGTPLAGGDTLEWRPFGDDYGAYRSTTTAAGSTTDGGQDASNQASAHDGWELCFA
jgi:hypothetical protein